MEDKKVIRFYYKNELVSESFITKKEISKGWINIAPPFQPENWDVWRVKIVDSDYKLLGE